MVADPVTVKPTLVFVLYEKLVPVRVHAPEPNAIVLVIEPLELKVVAVKLYEFALNVPAVKVNVLDIEKLSCKTTEPLGEFTVIGCGNVFPALVIF